MNVRREHMRFVPCMLFPYALTDGAGVRRENACIAILFLDRRNKTGVY
ncbi:MAG: hypothetical protein K2O15_12925 [Lachnospiraceae bacterium]|nr:hypothetical protein [Lachnospiraceae bacterium]